MGKGSGGANWSDKRPSKGKKLGHWLLGIGFAGKAFGHAVPMKCPKGPTILDFGTAKLPPPDGDFPFPMAKQFWGCLVRGKEESDGWGRDYVQASAM